VVDWDGAAPRRARAAELVTAHPHPGGDGTLVNVRVRFGRRCAYEVFAADPARGRVRTLGALATGEPAYVHSFGLTATTAVVVEAPWTVRPTELLRDAIAGRPFAESYRWREGRPTRWRLFDLAGGRAVATCEGPPLFAFHHVNAFDDGDAVVCDLVAYPDASVVRALYLDRLRDASVRVPGGRVQRWRLPRAGGRAELVAEHAPPLELPRVAAARDGRPYRHAYGCGAGDDGHFLDRVVKLDVARGTWRHWASPRCYPGEPVFVGRPGGQREDDGVLLTLVLDGAEGRSALVVLDAATLAEVARAEAPHAVPAGFHGEFWGETAD
jgi:carotenoid cleavage dioxygenase-like enzyme